MVKSKPTNEPKARLDAFIELQQEETLHLEFKTLASDSALTRDDRKLIAKAICGLSNAEGGQLVIGIETKKVDGVDVAFRKKPLAGIGRLKRLVSSIMPEILSPQHRGITVNTVIEDAGGDLGYLLVDVPSSQDRPHMSVPERRYFRRGSDGTRVLDHAEIRELMLAPREGSMKMTTRLQISSATGDLKYSLQLQLTLQNTGKVPIVAPYIRTRTSNWRAAVGLHGVMYRPGLAGSSGFYGSRDLLIHVDDELSLVQVPTGLDFRRTGLYHLKSAIEAVASQPNCLQMLPFSDMGPLGAAAHDRPISVSGMYGAENAIATDFAFDVGKQELLALFCQDPGLAPQLQ